MLKRLFIILCLSILFVSNIYATDIVDKLLYTGHYFGNPYNILEKYDECEIIGRDGKYLVTISKFDSDKTIVKYNEYSKFDITSSNNKWVLGEVTETTKGLQYKLMLLR